jgi:hypothetical protein
MVKPKQVPKRYIQLWVILTGFGGIEKTFGMPDQIGKDVEG